MNISLKLNQLENIKNSQTLSNNRNQIVIFVSAVSSSNAKAEALKQAKQQLGSDAGAVTIVSCRNYNL